MYNRVVPNRDQMKSWMQTRVKFLYDAPMFSHLLYTMMSRNDDNAYFTDDANMHTAATDERQIFINVNGFLSRPIGERVFVLAHEVLHGMFGHCTQATALRIAGHVAYPDGTKLPFDELKMQHAADYFCNALLAESKIGDAPKDAKLDAKYTTKMSVLDIYRDLMKDHDPNKPPGDPNFDDHLDPGFSDNVMPEVAVQQRNMDEWNMQIAAGMGQAMARGLLPDALKNDIEKILEPEVEWQQHIMGLFDRRIGTGGFDWRTPDKRLIARPDPIIAPGRIGYGCELVVVVGDSSGSVTQPTAEHFFGEMAGILDNLHPRRILFVWCDAKTHGWEEIEMPEDLSEVKRRGILGRGGTDFRPPFRELAEMGEVPDCLLYLTDGYGAFPKDPPPYPVIWGDITNQPHRYPWGDVVHIPLRSA